jgi:hypothetical protein
MVSHHNVKSTTNGATINSDERNNNVMLMEAVVTYVTKNYEHLLTSIERSHGDIYKCTDNNYQKMKTINVLYRPTADQFQIVYQDVPIDIRITRESSEKDGIYNVANSIVLECMHSLNILKKLVDQCYQEYVDDHYKHYDREDTLYYYDYATPHSSRSYPMRNNKTFEALFFDQKDEFLNLIHDFTTRKGIFSRAMIPYRLNILLYGIPGSGKTSCIKALANYTKRCVYNINLATITSNRDLTNIFYDRSDPNARKIFILEDIDAMSDVVKSRQPATTNADEKDSTSQVAPKSSTLTLSNILNLLDGVLELSESIIIMTTNHPEHLDPALIRPGRINLKLHLGKMSLPCAQQMLKYYYETDVFMEQLREANLEDRKFTPAELQETMMLSPRLEDFLERIKHKTSA